MKYLIIFLLCASSAFCSLGGVNGVAVEENAHFVGSADSISYTPTVNDFKIIMMKVMGE